MMNRIVRTIEYGKKHNLRTVIDAEQSYFQPAISRLAMAMMRRSDIIIIIYHLISASFLSMQRIADLIWKEIKFERGDSDISIF